MDLLDVICRRFYFNDHQKRKEMKKLWDALLPFISTILLCVGGCSHPASPISVASATDHISAVQGNLSAVDGKAVVIEDWLKSHK